MCKYVCAGTRAESSRHRSHRRSERLRDEARRASGDEVGDDGGGLYAAEALVEALVLEGEVLVIAAQEAQGGGVEVLEVNRFLALRQAIHG